MKRKHLLLTLFLVLMLVFAIGCDNGDNGDDYVDFWGELYEEGEPLEGMDVVLYDNGEEVDSYTTYDNGLFIFEDKVAGEYSLKIVVWEEEVEKTINVSEDGTLGKLYVIEDDEGLKLVDEPEDPDTAEARAFVQDFKNHTYTLMDLGEEQANDLQKAFTEEVIPYSQAVYKRLIMLENMVDIISELGVEDLPFPEPVCEEGDKYVLDYNEYPDGENWIEEEPGLTKEQWDELTDPEQTENWEWHFEVKNFFGEKTHVVNVEFVNIFAHFDDDELDITEGNFAYSQSIEGNDDFDWKLDLSLKSENTNRIEIDEELELIYPVDPDLQINEGIITDKLELNMGENNGDGEFFPSIGELKFDEYELTGDFEEGELNTSGEITGNSPELSKITMSEGLNLEFTPFKPEKVLSFDDIPLLQKINLNGAFSVEDYFEADGDFTVDFCDDNTYDIEDEGETLLTIALPEEIEFNGNYKNLSENDFELSGGITIGFDDPGEWEYAFEEEDEKNYLSVGINIDGELIDQDEKAVGVDFNIERTGYNKADIDFRYDFDSRYIEGNVDVDDDEEVFVLEAKNEKGLKIIIDEDKFESSEEKIGVIESSDDKELAEIILIGEPVVEFPDGVVIALLPELGYEEDVIVE